MKTVVVGLSGGVDSSIAAWLLKEQGYHVIGIFMKNWHDESVTISDECPWIDDSNDALLVAQKLNIPFQTLDLSDEYKKRIVDYMFAEYEAGRTPNPDVLCNREIKFDVFLKAAKSLGADYVATGHYCRKELAENGMFRLLAGKDKNKDQSYFLCQLTQDQLAMALFPIGDLEKSEVRKIAAEQDLVTADKKDSQGLCFVGKVKLPVFLQQQLMPKKGEIVEISADLEILKAYHQKVNEHDYRFLSQPFLFHKSDGKVKGEHQGAHYFTIGQRKGLQVGGSPLPLFVIATDTKENIIYTGQGEHHPGLNKNALFIKTQDVHWLRTDKKMKPGESQNYLVRIRYRQKLENATLFCEDEGVYILFENLMKGISPGQFAAWYEGEELIGSGVIFS
ncbi:MAG: tRNA 2-thiouridine(34) synthase MnmA [Crocinitomicaceae bacterium]|nr:tRNA 2-thiouridine(34) synthase MnmA [Crocinitomicaceae bacterium]